MKAFPFSIIGVIFPINFFIDPKKSSHVLKMLFNYVKYYKMVKETVCEKALETLSSYNEALATNNALQVKNEAARKRAANVSQMWMQMN